MNNLTLDDYVDTFDELKLDELVKSLNHLSTFDDIEVCSQNCCGFQTEDVVELAANYIDTYISEMLRDDISIKTYEAVAALPRYSFLLTTAVIRLYERKYSPLVLPELNLEFFE